jgi:hypothetical protein
MGSKDKGRAQEDALRAQAAEAAARSAAATNVAATPDPLEVLRRERVKGVEEWDMGKAGPKDIRNLPGADTSIALYRDAKTARDSGRIGRGFATMTDGTNPNFLASLDKEMGLERDLAASGALEENVNNILEGNKAELYGLSGMANSRNMSIAGMQSSADQAAQDRYLQYLMRPKQPSFLKQLALAGVGAAGQIGAAYCVTLDTFIHTPTGPRHIGEIKVGEVVTGYDATGRESTLAVVGKRTSPVEVVEIKAGAFTLRCTGSHELQRFVGDMSRVRADQFKVGQFVLTLGRDGMCREAITSIEPVGVHDVAILKLDNEHEYFAFVTNGILSIDDYTAEDCEAFTARS